MTFLSKLDEAKSAELRAKLIKKELYDIVSQILEISPGDFTDETNLQDAGFDSQKLMKLRAKLNQLVDERIEVNPYDLTGCYTISKLSVRLVEVIYEDKETMKAKYKEELCRIINKDLVLPDHIKIAPECLPAIPVQEISCVFVTGTTGNMGPYYVQQLSKMPQISRIVCLVRSTPTQSGETRLFCRLKELGLLGTTQWEKVEVVEGDLTTDLFGLEPHLYDSLAHSMEGIVQNAVCASHLELYGEGASHLRGVRAVNVEGTLRVLEFAMHKRVKSILNPSTVLTMVGKFSEDEISVSQKLPDHWVSIEDSFFDIEEGEELYLPNFGYFISKYIADTLIGQAVQRGVPAKIFRFPKIFGDTKNGAFSITENHFVVKFLYFVKSGVMPDDRVPLQALPVDAAVKVSLLIFFNPAIGNEIFNVLNAKHDAEPDVMKQYTKEYGPLFRIASHMWEVLEVMKNKGQTLTGRKSFEIFLEGLKLRVKAEGIDLSPLLEFITKEISITGDIIENPNLLLKNIKVRKFILTEYAYDLELVPFRVFMKHLVQDGPLGFLYKWMDFYVREDSSYLMGRESSSDQAQILANSVEKVVKCLPEYESIMPSSESVVRQAFEYTLDHATDIFKTLLYDQAKFVLNLMPD